MSNKLEKEKSPYLRQHKDNPVDWYPWGKEAFQKAENENKPIFLSIGYSTCHWCHVMAHESFEDSEIAKLLEDFVCIKVDREERPDIDAVYMNFCQTFTGSGGWPLTIFMTPGQMPFFAGTYFPKENRYGQPGLTELLKQISHLWKTDKEMLLESSEKIVSMLKENNSLGIAKTDKTNRDDKADKELLWQAYRLLWQGFDSYWGGFGVAPKFPSPHKLLFLLRMYEEENISEALYMVETTLKSMARGGLFDHIGGGFSRYSTDEKWLVPHFEKMLYDNALLILAYLEAFQLAKNPFYAEVARRTADYVLEELADEKGGFYCGQDADSDGIEGKYYVFTPDEIIDVLGPENGGKFCQMYNITEQGNFEGKSIPNRINGIDGELSRYSHDFDGILKILRDYRKTRTKLHLDNKILLSWNSWMIIALARAGLVLDNHCYMDAALKAQKFITENMISKEKRLFHCYYSGEAANDGQLEDYAVYALSLIELYRTTLNADFLAEARFWAKRMMDLFEDKENGGYFITANDAETLIFRPKEIFDGAIPSGNSVAEAVLQQLGFLTGELTFSEAAYRQYEFMSEQMKEYPTAYCFALTAMADALYPHSELVCTGNSFPGEAVKYLADNPAHNLSIIYKSKDNAEKLAQIATFTKSYKLSEAPEWYLCENGKCLAPVEKFEELELTGKKKT